ncbi:unnamed protein product [Rotaria sp. Silwood2]|nr:unnamed protein product [Rotaria sp. Silwood2]
MILGKMREIAERYLGNKVKNAVVTVPAYFNDAQRQATKDAGKIAGFNVIRIINEPTAEAIAYGSDKMKNWKDAKNILVFDLGGGTFDVSLLTFDNGLLEVLATDGDTHLDGEDFDQRVIDHFIKLFKTKKEKDVGKNAHTVENFVVKLKKRNEFYFSEILTRAKLEELNMDLFRSTMKPVENVLQDAELEKSDIADVLLVGGSTRIPKIRQILKEFFNGKEPSRAINPDEAVVYGAAIQEAILAGDDCIIDEIVIIDVNPLTMGIEVKDGAMSNIIPRNSHIPKTNKQIFTTVRDDQDTVTVRIFEDERPIAKYNHFLGEFDLTGIPLAPRGVTQIDVTFDIDVDGVLTVTAEEKTRGNKKNIMINSKTNRLSSNEIDRMIKVAELFADEDKIVKERINAKNELESYIYLLRNQLKDLKTFFEELLSKEKSIITNAIENQIKWIDTNPNVKVDQFRKQKKQLETIILQIMSKIHGYNVNNTRSQSSQYYGEL